MMSLSLGKQRTKLFVSYSHKDSIWLEELRPHLKSLALEKDFDTLFWDDTQIKAGSDWMAEIGQALDAAKVAILLISKHFLSSDFITSKELPSLLTAAKQNNTLILPIILSPCRYKYHPQLSVFQSVNPPSDPIEGMSKVNYENTFLKVTELIDEAITKDNDKAVVINPPEEKIIDSTQTVKTNEFRGDPPSLEIFAQPEILQKPAKTITNQPKSISEEKWTRLVIQSLPDGSLQYQTIQNDTRLESRLLPLQRKLMDSLAEKCLNSWNYDPQLASALFELLMPVDIKSTVFQSDGTILILDSTTAMYPWELLIDSADGNNLPVSVRHPLIRQTISNRFTPHSKSNQQKVLIIGDPDTQSFAMQLPGARKEANQVADMFRNSGFTLSSQIGSSAPEILSALFSDTFQVLHMAGHGVYEFQSKESSVTVTGFLIGKDLFFTGYEVSQMSTAPDFVFLNAPYLGRHASWNQSHDPVSSVRFADSFPDQFISIGTRALIAPAGSIEDVAAGTFATTFYEELLNGKNFAKAVLAARKKTYLAHKDSSTFGMYLCYGDPDYQLTKESFGSGSNER